MIVSANRRRLSTLKSEGNEDRLFECQTFFRRRGQRFVTQAPVENGGSWHNILLAGRTLRMVQEWQIWW